MYINYDFITILLLLTHIGQAKPNGVTQNDPGKREEPDSMNHWYYTSFI